MMISIERAISRLRKGEMEMHIMKILYNFIFILLLLLTRPLSLVVISGGCALGCFCDRGLSLEEFADAKGRTFDFRQPGIITLRVTLPFEVIFNNATTGSH